MISTKDNPSKSHDKTPYDEKFYEKQVNGSLQSARVIVPLVMRLVSPQSVLDVGCGVGTWLRAFSENGVERITGIDGKYVCREQLLIDPDQFVAMDLTKPQKIENTFDLAVCLEVGEHLPASSARALVTMLTDAASVVLFSAAVPGQGGTNHINERWPSWWRKLFSDRGFERLDPIRREVWFNERVDLHYRQNVYLYASRDVIATSSALQVEYRLAQHQPLEIVNGGILEQYESFGNSLRQSIITGWRAARKLWTRD